MSGYNFNKNAPDGEEATLANGVTYKYNAAKDRWDTIGASGDDLDTKYVKKDGDIMTGDLEVKGVAKATELKSTKLNSGEDSNLSIQRRGDTKLLIAPKETLAYQPVKYNDDYTLNHERNLITKGYVDEAIDEVNETISDLGDVSSLSDQVKENTDDIEELFDAASNAAAVMGDSTVKTNAYLDESMTRSWYDGDNDRVISIRGYFNGHSTTKTANMMVTDMSTGVSTALSVNNPMNPGRIEQLSQGFKIGDDWAFPTAENPKDCPFVKLDPSNNLSYYGGEDGLRITKNWAIINYVLPLDDSGRYFLMVGNPSERLDANGGNGSRQAQVTAMVDVEDIVNQTQIEEHTDNNTGVKYGCVSKTISSSRGGIAKKCNGEIYLLQPGKQLQKVVIKDLPTKDVALTTLSGAGGNLPWDHLLDADGKRIEEIGKINGVSRVNDRYIIWHALNVGIMCYDTVEDTLEQLLETDNFIEYGVNRTKQDSHVPEVHKALWYIPHAYTGKDGVDVPLEIIKISTEDLSIERIALPDNRSFTCNSSSKIGLNKIVMTNWTSDVLFYDVVKQTFNTSDVNEPVGVRFCIGDDNYFTPKTTTGKPVYFVKHTVGLSSETVANTNFLENEVIKEHDDFIAQGQADATKSNVAYNMAHTNRSAILSVRDAIDDNLAPKVKKASENENYVVQNLLLEAATHISPKEDHPLYHIANTDFVMFTRMFEGAKKTEDAGGNIVSNNQTLDSNRYGNDHLGNMMLFHIPTGKSLELRGAACWRPDNQGLPDGVDVANVCFPTMRGMNVVPNDDGSQNIYLWIHNPLRTNHPDGVSTVPKNNACPLYRIYIPPKDNVDNSDPFRNIVKKWTEIRCDESKFTTPANNPYGNYESDTTKTYQYEISPYTFDLVDPVTGIRHYFMMSHNKGSKDYVTSRVFQIVFDPDGNPDNGEIVPVRAHPLSSHGEYAAGHACKKKDIYDVERLFMYGSPMGLTEVYFTNEKAGVASTKRLPELRNYADYVPEGPRVTSATEVNAIGHALIDSKGIADNWYKSSTLNPQPLTNQPYDPDDKLSNIIVWYQSAYGVCSLNVQDLGVIDRSDETKLENNFQGTNLSALCIENRDNIYQGYLQDFSSRNLARFNTQQLDSHSQGSLWYFDYKPDYPYPVDKVGTDGEQHLYNDTRVYNNNGDLIEQDIFKRPIIEVRPNETTGRIEIHCVPTGRARYPYGTETQDENFCGESVTKVNDVFICGGASKSHSSIGDPKLYMFNPGHRSVHRLSNERVDMTSIFSSNKHGIVMGAPYGVFGNDTGPDQGTPIFMVDMQESVNKAQTPRSKASDLRKLYTLTGNEAMIDEDPETWRIDEPEETSESSVVIDCGSDFEEYDE